VIAIQNIYFFFLKDVTNTKGHEFTDYDLKHELMLGLVSVGYDKPSPV